MRKSLAPDALSIITSEIAHQAACQLQTFIVWFSFSAARKVVICNGPIREEWELRSPMVRC